RQMIGRDADAGVLHGNQGVIPSRDDGVLALNIFVVEGNSGGLDLKPAALGHGVAGVHSEVHENLFDLNRIDTDAAEVVTGGEAEFDIFADQAVQGLDDVADDRVEFHHAQCLLLFTAEGQ